MAISRTRQVVIKNFFQSDELVFRKQCTAVQSSHPDLLISCQQSRPPTNTTLFLRMVKGYWHLCMGYNSLVIGPLPSMPWSFSPCRSLVFLVSQVAAPSKIIGLYWTIFIYDLQFKGIATRSDENERSSSRGKIKLFRPSLDVPHGNEDTSATRKDGITVMLFFW